MENREENIFYRFLNTDDFFTFKNVIYKNDYVIITLYFNIFPKIEIMFNYYFLEKEIVVNDIDKEKYFKAYNILLPNNDYILQLFRETPNIYKNCWEIIGLEKRLEIAIDEKLNEI